MSSISLPSTPINLSSCRKAKKAGILWDTKKDILFDAKGPICQLFDQHDHWVVEYNPVESMDEDSADEEVFKPRHLAPVYPHTPVY
jgi:hypothetical protein